MRDIEKENLINKIILSKIFKGIIVVFMIAFMVLVAACKEAPAVVEEQQEEEKPSGEIPSETIPKETKKETPPVVEETPEEIEWEGVKITPIEGLRFDKGTFFAEAGNPYGLEAGVEAGIWVKEAFKLNGEWQPSIGFSPEVLKVINDENKKKGLFVIAWPFNFQENNNLEIFELISTGGGGGIGIKYSESVKFYNSYDCPRSLIGQYIPAKEDPYSLQAYKSVVCYPDFKAGGAEAMYGINFVDWNPLINLGKPYSGGASWRLQDIGQINLGELLGELLPSNPDFNFLDYANNPNRFKNPGQFQATLSIGDFNDELKGKYSTARIMKEWNKNKEITVFVWPRSTRPANEQTN